MATKKHQIQCPHCSRDFVWTPPVKKKSESVEKANPVFTACVEYWLKTFHIGWTFGPVQGSALKSLIKKIQAQILLGKKMELTDENVVMSFTYICEHLPEYFKDKDLQVLNSKYNEIIEQMKRGVTPQGNGYNQKTSAGRYADSAYRS